MAGTRADDVVELAGELVHRCALYDSLDEAGRLAEGLLREGLRSGRAPVVAVLVGEVEQQVRARLGADGDAVEFLRPEPGRAGGRVIWDHLDRRGDRGRVFTVVCGDMTGDPYGSVCLETEVLGNRELAGLDEEHSCLYPRRAPHERVARLSHPVLRERGVDALNLGYRRPERLVVDEVALAHLDPVAETREVVPHVDPDLRGWLAERARAAGFDAATVDQLVLAGHEALRAGAESLTAARNGARQACGLGIADADSTGLPLARLYLHRSSADDRRPGTGLVVDVDSALLPGLPADRLPADPALKGLWLADKACPGVTITVHPLTPTRGRIRVRAATEGAPRP